MLSGKKILLVGSYYFENLGDPLFIITTKRMLEQQHHANVDVADLFGRTHLSVASDSDTVTVKNKKSNLLKKMCKKMLRIPYRACKKAMHKTKLQKMYSQMVQGYDAVVIPGGGFISFSRTFPYHDNIGALADACRKQKIAFCMNAVGVCRDVDCLLHEEKWKRILHSESVRYLTCRDGKQLIEQVCGYPVKQVACTAVSAGDLFEIYRDKSSETIGIGVIRGNAFSSYGFDLSEEQLIGFYVDLGKELQSQGYRVKYFTNGLMSDYDIGRKVVALLNDDTLLLKRPETPDELLSQIASFKTVAVARLHAAISALSLNVPTVLFCWGVKGKDFMQMAGASSYAISPENMTVPYVTERIKSVMEHGWDQEKRQELQKNAADSILAMCEALTENKM